MRGLDEIKKINENPSAFHGEEQFGTLHRGRATGDETGGLETLLDQIINNSKPKPPSPTGRLTQDDISRGVAEVLADLVIGAALHAAVGGGGERMVANGGAREFAERPEATRVPRKAVPDFVEFWDALNKQREWDGKPEANYGEAKDVFSGGPTPVGAMTFIGKQFDGLRAVPAEPVKYLGGSRPAYHGEYREVTRLGTKWHKVVNGNDLPIAYKIPEAAICGAEVQRDERIEKSSR